MVKLRGPMFSLGASGTLADAVTFSMWKGRPYARERVIPSNPKSGAQVGRRAMLSFLSKAWNALDTSAKVTWQDLADELVASPFNAYIAHNLARWHNFLTPGMGLPISEAATPSDRVLSAAVWEENRIKISSTATTANDQWGIVIFGSTTTPIVESVGLAILALLDDDIAARDYFWTPPSVDTWYFDSIAFSTDGDQAAAGGEVNAVP